MIVPKLDSIRVTPSTLFKKKEYKGLTKEQQWSKALDNGWRFDCHTDKFYRIFGY